MCLSQQQTFLSVFCYIVSDLLEPSICQSFPVCCWQNTCRHCFWSPQPPSFVRNFEYDTGLLTCALPNLSTANRSYKISTRKNFNIVTKQRKPGELTLPEQQKERARDLHHNYKKQQNVPSTHHDTIQNLSGIQLLLKINDFHLLR